MARKKLASCSDPECGEPASSLGLCDYHYQAREQERRLTNDAVNLLHRSTVDGALPSAPELREELQWIQKWWNRVCTSLNYSRPDPLLKDEAEYAKFWCIAWAKEIVKAERAQKSSQNRDSSYEYNKEWIHDRFNNLEQGLQSNGLPRR